MDANDALANTANGAWLTVIVPHDVFATFPKQSYWATQSRRNVWNLTPRVTTSSSECLACLLRLNLALRCQLWLSWAGHKFKAGTRCLRLHRGVALNSWVWVAMSHDSIELNV